MLKRLMVVCLLLFPVVCLAAQSDRTGTIMVNVSKCRNDNGQVCYGLFKNGEGFPVDIQKAFRTAYAPVKDGQSTVEFIDVPYGNYAIGVFQDENGNNKMDTVLSYVFKDNNVSAAKDNIITGMEGYGTSNNVKETLLISKFSDAAFQFKTANRSVEISLQYSKYNNF